VGGDNQGTSLGARETVSPPPTMLSLASALRLPSQSRYAQPPQRTTRPQLQQQQERDDRGVLLPRRSLLAALPALVALPQHSWAGLFEAGPQGEFRSLVDSLSKVDDLTGQLQRGELKKEDDALVVLQTATIYFKGIAATMDKASAEMTLLDAAEQERAAALTASFRQELEALFVGCRTKAPAAQQAAAEKAGGALRDYLGVAAARYKVPALVQPARYSSDPEKFAAQYYGFLSCEGQGMARPKGSNSCVNRVKEGEVDEGSGFLDFDFLTGKRLQGK
jgi:hypothetical protein